MAQYRIFTVGQDGHIKGPAEIVECADDQEAIEEAAQLANGLDLEIWDRGRLVTRLSGGLPKSLRIG